MSLFFKSIETDCEEIKQQFACVKNTELRGYAGSWVQIEVIFYANEHIYLAEKMAGKDLIDRFDGLRSSISRAARKLHGTREGHNIVVRCEWV